MRSGATKTRSIYVAGIRTDDRARPRGVGRRDACWTGGHVPATCRRSAPNDWSGSVTQAALQVEARTDPDRPPPFRLTEAERRPVWGRGLELLPEPDDGDVFLDFEGDPFWTVESGLFFLFGLIARDADEAWAFEARWAHDRAGEEQATGELIELPARTGGTAHPDMHVYHYNHTERSALERLAADHGVGEAMLSDMVETGLFVDLYPVVRNAIQVGTESYGLKDLERLTDYRARPRHRPGCWRRRRVRALHGRTRPRHPRAHRRLQRGRRPGDPGAPRLAGRAAPSGRCRGGPAELDPEDEHPELDARIAALHAFGPGTPEHLLGDLLGYWVRECRAYKAPKLASIVPRDGRAARRPRRASAGCEFVRLEPRLRRQGSGAEVAGCPVPLSRAGDLRPISNATARQVLYGSPTDRPGTPASSELDDVNGEVVLVWNDEAMELGVFPAAVAYHDWVQPNPKPEALDALAARCARRPGLDGPQPGVTEPAPPGRPGLHAGRWPTRGHLRRRPGRDVRVGDAPRRQLHLHPGPAGNRQDVLGRPPRPQPHRRRAAGRHHRHEPPRHRQPARGDPRGVRREGRPLRSSRRSARCRSPTTPEACPVSTTSPAAMRPAPRATSTSSPAPRGCSPARTCGERRSTC